MLRQRDYPLVFAALVIAFLIGALVWTASPQLCPEQSQQSASSNQTNTQNNAPAATGGQGATQASDAQCDEHTRADWWAVRIGLLTAAILFGQFLMFFWQLQAMRSGVRDAAIARGPPLGRPALQNAPSKP